MKQMHSQKDYMIYVLSAAAAALIAAAAMPGAHALAAEEQKTVICLDPGHGGTDEGAKTEYDGVLVMEKDINLRIAKKLRRALHRYEGVETVMTRFGNKEVSIKERIDIAGAADADVVISLHNNQAHDAGDRSINGCMVLVPVSRYSPAGCRKDIYGIGTVLGENIIEQLQALGIPLSTDFDTDKTGGLLRRPYNRREGMARKDVRYPDGSWADYYGLIRYGVEAGLPVVIVEHAYVSNEDDLRTYLSSSDSIRKLADADAKGIAGALGLKLKTGAVRQGK